jgi:hypothetical protein
VNPAFFVVTRDIRVFVSSKNQWLYAFVILFAKFLNYIVVLVKLVKVKLNFNGRHVFKDWK